MNWDAHIPVMCREAVSDYLKPVSGGAYLDGTIGIGGHAEAILEASSPDGRLLGCDRDPAQLAIARERLARFGDRATLVRGSFERAVEIAASANFGNSIDGFLIDTGVARTQLSPEGAVGQGRGFSRRGDEPLSMSYDPDSSRTAAGLLRDLSDEELREMFGQVLRPGEVGRVVRAIVRARRIEPIETTGQLTGLLESVFGAGDPKADKRISACYLAIRILVNQELEALDAGILAAMELLRPGGVLVVLTFHGAETRLVRRAMRDLAGGHTGPPRLAGAPDREARVEILTPKPLFPTEDEIRINSAARSARLHAARKL